MKLKTLKNSKGFTIVELLIVIIIIGILAALVLNSFRGVQERARDTERQTDVNAEAGQLEVFYADKGGYPAFADAHDDGWISTNLKGADLNAWRAPGQSANSMENTATPSKDQYGYTPLNDDGSACSATAGQTCAKFKLYWHSEKDGSIHVKDSLN